MITLTTLDAAVLRIFVGTKAFGRVDAYRRASISGADVDTAIASLLALGVLRKNKAGAISCTLGYDAARALISAQGITIEEAQAELTLAEAAYGNASKILRDTPRGTWPYTGDYDSAAATVSCAQRRLESARLKVKLLSQKARA